MIGSWVAMGKRVTLPLIAHALGCPPCAGAGWCRDSPGARLVRVLNFAMPRAWRGYRVGWSTAGRRPGAAFACRCSKQPASWRAAHTADDPYRRARRQALRARRSLPWDQPMVPAMGRRWRCAPSRSALTAVAVPCVRSRCATTGHHSSVRSQLARRDCGCQAQRLAENSVPQGARHPCRPKVRAAGATGAPEENT